jgi:hypothetical protein
MAIIEQRRYPRRDVLEAVMVTPNGDRHDAVVLDMSLGGARMRLPDDWAPKLGAALRVFFLFDTSDAVTLEGRVTRVAVDHMGVQFAPEQEERIRALLDVVGRH